MGCTQGARGHNHCGGSAVARRHSRCARCSSQSFANQPQLGPGFCVGQHRSNDTGCGSGFHCLRLDAYAGSGHQINRVAGSIAVCLYAFAKHRPHYGSAGNSSSGAVSNIFVHNDSSLSFENLNCGGAAGDLSSTETRPIRLSDFTQAA